MKRGSIVAIAVALMTCVSVEAFAQADHQVEVRDGRIIIIGPGNPPDAGVPLPPVLETRPVQVEGGQQGEIRLGDGPRIEARDGKVFVDAKEVEHGKVGVGMVPEDQPPWLGITFEPAEDGMRVTQVFEDSPAAKAGLEAGDVITEIGGVKPTGMEDLRNAVVERKAGDELAMKVRRGEEQLEIKAKLEARPVRVMRMFAGPPAADPRMLLGIVCENDEKGVRVKEVVPDSPAAEAGIKVDDIIQSVDTQPVVRISELKTLLNDKAGEPVALGIERDGKEMDVKVTLEKPEIVELPPPVFIGPGGPGRFVGPFQRYEEELEKTRKEVEALRKQVEELQQQLEELRKRLGEQTK